MATRKARDNKCVERGALKHAGPVHNVFRSGPVNANVIPLDQKVGMQRGLRLLRAILLAPVWLPLSLIVFTTLGLMSIPVSISGYFAHRRWKRKLFDSGRTMLASNLPETVSGTFIVDRPAMGWNTTYCWWTQQSIPDVSPVPVPTDDERKQFITDNESLEHPFDRWCYDNFLSADTGSALLIATKHGDRIADGLAHDHPNAKLITSWSAFCLDADVNRNGNRAG